MKQALPLDNVRTVFRTERKEMRMRDLICRFIETFAPARLWQYWHAMGYVAVWAWKREVHATFELGGTAAVGGTYEGFGGPALASVLQFRRLLENLGLKVEVEQEWRESYHEKALLSVTLKVDCKPYGRWPKEPEGLELVFRGMQVGPHCAIEETTTEEWVEPTEGHFEERTTRWVKCVDPSTGEVTSREEVK